MQELVFECLKNLITLIITAIGAIITYHLIELRKKQRLDTYWRIEKEYKSENTRIRRQRQICKDIQCRKGYINIILDLLKIIIQIPVKRSFVLHIEFYKKFSKIFSKITPKPYLQEYTMPIS
jgi:hypothetical protein